MTKEVRVTVLFVDAPIRWTWGGFSAPSGFQFVYIAEGRPLIAFYDIAERLKNSPVCYVLSVTKAWWYFTSDWRIANVLRKCSCMEGK